ncbi:OprD family outer membrane porin [Sulfurospirillum cavolei]|uniref:OprD family outer membrane porin n=1 Tax=Sulfurospirillum cavolei TaxID=366522 RepID=UPI003FA27587
MKLAKLSLAAMVVAGLASSSFAADTLADAFKNGKVSGELRAWYFDRDYSTEKTSGTTPTSASTKDADIFNVGVILGYVTDSFYGFKLGATVQSNYAPFADSDAKADFASDMYGSGAQLSEAYIQYNLGKTTATVGRQFISTPLVNGSGSRMIKQAFEGATIVNTDLPATTLVAGVITKYQARTSSTIGLHSSGDVGEFDSISKIANKALGLTGSKALDDGDYAYTLLAINKSITGTTLTAQWAEIVNVVDMYYLEAAYAGKAGEFSYGLAANYQYADWDSAISSDAGTMYGAKASLGYGDFKAYVAYTEITDDAGIGGIDGGAGLGGGAQTAFAQAKQVTTGTYEKDSKAYSVDANYNFSQIGLLVGARYTDLKVDSSQFTPDRGYTDLYTTYTFTGALKGLSADLSYQDWSKDIDGQELWFKANYKF